MLTDNRLNDLRAQLAQLLPGTAILQEPAGTSDGAGGFGTAWTPVAAGTVPCRLDPLPIAISSRIDTSTERESLQTSARLTVPYDAPLAAGQRAVIDGTAYEVERLEVAHSWRVSRRAIVSRVE